MYESSGRLRKSQWKFDMNHLSQRCYNMWGFMIVVDIYINLTGENRSEYLQFVTKFCSGGHLVLSQEFTKVVDVYKKQWTLNFNVIPMGHVLHVNTHMNTNTAPKT